MGSLDADEGNVPWGKYTYALEGLATGCYLEGACEKSSAERPGAPQGQKLRFRVELPARCFVLSVAVKLPNAPEAALVALDDVEIERTLSNGEYETVYDGYATKKAQLQEKEQHEKARKAQNEESDNGEVKVIAEEPQSDSPTSIDQTYRKPGEDEQKLPRKKVMEVRRAADSLRLTITDIDETPKSSPLRRRRSTESEDGSDTEEFRTLGVVVVGYVRGQTPASNRIKILLNSSAKLGLHIAKADRAEVDGLLGLAFLGNRRYRQAAELLQRASELVVEVAKEDAKSGFATDDAYTWAAELNLLSAYAYFEHMPKSNDGIIRLVKVANASKTANLKASGTIQKDSRDLATEFLDLRTELLIMLEDLLTMLVQFLGDSNSLAVKLASSRMIEFVCEQLGCAVAKYLSRVLNQVLRLYPDSMTFGARERAAAASFSYDSMEDCFERLIDLCCRLFPLTEHSVLHDLYDNTLVPVFLDGFQESKYLCFEADAEEEADELMTTAVAQTLRVIYLVLNIIGADARIPTSLVSRILNVLVMDSGSPRTPILLRRTALHTWDALSKALIHSARGNTVKVFADHIKVLQDYLPKLLVDLRRSSFEYGELEEEADAEVEVIKEEYVTPDNSQVLKDLLKKRGRRIEIADRHTLKRLLSLIHDICDELSTSEDEEERYMEVIVSLQKTLGHSIADLVMSSLIDVSYHEAIASGNGPEESNNTFEFGDIQTQLGVVSDILEDMFETYWSTLRLLPQTMTAEAVRNAPIRAVLGWCVHRMRHSAPPRGMLRLLFVIVKGLQHDLNAPMYNLPTVPEAPHEVTFIAIHRAHLQWFSQSSCEEAFDLMDTLIESVSQDLMATDLSLLIQALGDQGEQYQGRTDSSLDLLANVVASCTPKRPDLAMSSLKALEDPSVGNQRIANGFPKSNRSNTGSFTRRMQFSAAPPRVEPMSKSLYVHVVLASCFDRFDALARATKQRAGPSFMGDKIDAFVEHAALCVRCLHACARARKHREYVGAVLGDIFSTCLAMQAHGDGRVRLAGFEIFAASLDILFLAQKAMVLPQQASMANDDMAVMGAASGAPTVSSAQEETNGITELSPSDSESNGVRSVAGPVIDLVRSNSLPSSLPPTKQEDLPDEKESTETDDEDAEVEKRMQGIFAEGGSCSFHSETESDLSYEEKGWQMLCAFVTSSLERKYIDFVVQRACLEYLKSCLLSALCGRSTGASVIAFEHIEPLWDAVNKLIGSPWRALNGLAMWVICIIVNIAIYSSVMAKGRGATRQRSAQLHDFAFNQVFPKAESLLKHGTRETRVWGMRLLEVYVKARDLNVSVVQTVPPPPFRVLRALDTLKHDWNEDIREGSQSLLEVHYNSTNKKATSQMTSFTAQAQNFMSMKRYQANDMETADSSRIELWFPPLPAQAPHVNIDVYCRTLDAFANAEIDGGEETEVTKVEEENDDQDDEYEGDFEEEEEGYEFDEVITDAAEVAEEGAEAVLKEELQELSSEETTPSEDEIQGEADGSQLESHTAESKETEKASVVSGLDSRMIQEEDVDDQLDEEGTGREELTSERPRRSAILGDGEDEDGAGEEEDDHEFTLLRPGKAGSAAGGPRLGKQLSDPESDLKLREGRAERRGSSDDDLVDEDEVVNVTDEDDVLVDVESMPEDKRLSRRSTGPTVSSGSMPGLARLSSGEQNARLRRPGSAPKWSSPKSPNASLNPDLDEGVHVLRRKGSFTSRSTSAIHIEEGEAPKLARRRSLDMKALSSVIDSVGENRPSYQDSDVTSPTSLGSKLSRRRSSKSPSSSPRATDRIRSDGGDSLLPAESSKEEEIISEASDPTSPNSARQPRRKSSKGVTGTGEDETKDARQRPPPGEQVKDDVRGGAFLSLSPKGPRIPRGIKLDEDTDDVYEARPPISPADGRGVSERPRSRSRSEGRPSSSKSGRRLPRAPAFVKGAGPQRRIPAPLPIGGSDRDQSDTKDEQQQSAKNSTGGESSSSSPSLGGAPRPRLPRGRSQTGKPFRPGGTGEGERAEKKTDRSHRFSRREPLSLPMDDSDDFEKDLLADLDVSFGAVDDLGNQVRVGTPTAESLKSRRTLADDQPTSGYKRRGSKRDVADSAHYKSLLDQMGPGGTEEGPRSSGLLQRREAEKTPSSRGDGAAASAGSSSKDHGSSSGTNSV